MVTVSEIPDWLRETYPFAPHAFTTPAGARMNYVDEGEGDEAVLMLHGNPTWSYYYTKLIRTVSPRIRCIAPDHIGMGLSEKPEGYAYTLQTRIADLEALASSLELSKIHLVVHDWGGAIGMGFAGRHPEKIGRIVILNTAAFPSVHIPMRIAACRFPGLGPLLVRGANGFAGPASWMSMHRRKLTPDEKRALLFPYDSWAHRVAVNGFVQDIPMSSGHQTWDTLAQVSDGLKRFENSSMFIVWGGRDFCFNDHFYNEWTRRFPQAKTKYLDDVGHYVLLDADEEVVPDIADFLTSET